VPEPSIKGSVFRGVVEDLLHHRQEGRVRPGEIDAELTARDRAFLEETLQDGSWYPIATYARMTDLLCAKVGGGRVEYYLERGARSAKRLLAAGLYSQLDFLSRWREQERSGGGGTPEAMLALYTSKLKLVISLAGAIYNVGRWEVVPDPRDALRVCIEIRDADSYSEGMRYAIQGFLNECTRAVRPDIEALFHTERPARDRILIEMTMGVERLYAPAAA